MPDSAFPAFVRRYLIRPIDGISEFLGRAIAWLALAMAAVTFVVVVMRYVLGVNSTAFQESVVYMHAAVFLLGSAYTLKNEGHVRVDIFYRRFSRVQKAWVDSVGTMILLLPMCGFLLVITWHTAITSWRIGEISAEAGGIPAVFLLKSIMPLAAATLALQGLAEVLRNLLTLMMPDLNDND